MISTFLASYSNSTYLAQISAASVIAIFLIIFPGWLCQRQTICGQTRGAITAKNRPILHIALKTRSSPTEVVLRYV
ncbi:hypothetical protein BWR18_02615 [Tateyamaria omphalii]|uniref:Uncharacterized protein n=1 Tax=Tateyamaria omphalii TaxID=299262 RepID=A0A1P8MRJ8_9RHOB|nr:hypothetical protein BWR18_02615 [Tateyamaria omphalii]